MHKIRIVQNAKTIDFAGTSRVATTFCKYLNMDSRFECYLLYNELADNNRLEECKKAIGEQFLIPYKWIGQPNGQAPYWPKETNLSEVLHYLKPLIVHSHRSCYPEAFSFKSWYPAAKYAASCIFGYADNANIDLYIYICDYIRRTALLNGATDGPVILNPIEHLWVEPPIAFQYLVKKYQIPENATILARVGRPDNFSDISLKAFELILKKHPDTYYLIVGGCQNWHRVADKLGVNGNCRFIDPIVDDRELAMIFNGSHINAHARQDGECMSTSIAHFMAAGVPVVSHEGTAFNGHIEQLDGIGFVVKKDNYRTYADSVSALIEDENLYDSMSEGSIQRAQAYKPEVIIEQLKDAYLWLLEQ